MLHGNRMCIISCALLTILVLVSRSDGQLISHSVLHFMDAHDLSYYNLSHPDDVMRYLSPSVPTGGNSQSRTITRSPIGEQKYVAPDDGEEDDDTFWYHVDNEDEDDEGDDERTSTKPTVPESEL